MTVSRIVARALVSALAVFGTVVAVQAAPAAAAPGSIPVPALSTIKLTGAAFSACNALTYGYQVGAGPLVPVGSKASGCANTTVADAAFTVPSAATIRIYLTDNTCSFTFFSDGDHADLSGPNPFLALINDGASGCTSPPGNDRFPTGGSANLSVTVTVLPGCTTSATGNVVGPVTVNSLQNFCANSTARIYGPITVNPGGALHIIGSQVANGITTNGAVEVFICGASLSGPGTSVTSSPGLVVIGDPALPCAGSRIVGPLTVNSNSTVIVGGNTVAGNVTVDNNTPYGTTVKANILLKNGAQTGVLDCQGNNPAPGDAGQPNTAPGGKLNQCSSL